jgi:hypothetical protein
VCPSPATKAGGTHSPGGEGDGGSIFWKTRDIGLACYRHSNNLSTLCSLWSGAGGCELTGLANRGLLTSRLAMQHIICAQGTISTSSR